MGVLARYLQDALTNPRKKGLPEAMVVVSRNPSPLGSRTLTGDTLVEILRQRFRLGHRRILAAVADLTEDQLRWKPTPTAHSIAFNLWHLARCDPPAPACSMLTG